MSTICYYLITVILGSIISSTEAQDYQVSEIVCHETSSQGGANILSARIRKPKGFRGYPAFADNRKIKANTDEHCRIQRDEDDVTGTIYKLKITDFTRCPVLKNNQGYVTVKIWFPQLDGVVMMNDQDVVIMCKPPEIIVTQNKAAGFAGNIESSTRVSGVVEEKPGKLEYELALFKEATTRSGNFEIPVEGAISIGTILQLRARINTKSAWRYLKLTEVTVASNPQDPYTSGYITLVKDGCRLKEYENIVPKQPHRTDDNPGEVTLEFEAFLLENTMMSSQMWIHAQIKACIEVVDCLPEFCMDLYQPSGHGRKKRSYQNVTSIDEPPKIFDQESSSSNEASIGENIGITVIVPGNNGVSDVLMMENSREGCTVFLALTGVLSCLLLFTTGTSLALAHKVHRYVYDSKTSSIESIYGSSVASTFGRPVKRPYIVAHPPSEIGNR